MDDQANQVEVGTRGSEHEGLARWRSEGGRMSRRRKRAAVVGLLRGEELETV